MKYIRNRISYLKESSNDIDDEIVGLLHKGDIEESKILVDNINSYSEYQIDDCLKVNKEFTEYVYEKRPHLFKTHKSKYSSSYNITNIYRSFNLIKFKSKYTKDIIDDLFNKSFNNGIIRLVSIIIDEDINNNFLKDIMLEIFNRFGKDNDISIIDKNDNKTTKYNLNLLRLISNQSNRIKKYFNTSFIEILDNNPHLSKGLTVSNKVSIIESAPDTYKDEITKFLLGKLKPNHYWKLYVRNNTLEEIKNYIHFIKSEPKLNGIKNILKIKHKILDEKYIKLLKDEGILKFISKDISRLWMNSTTFLIKYMVGGNMFDDNIDNDLIQKGKEMIELLISSGGVTKEEIANQLIDNFNPYSDSPLRAFNNEIGRTMSLGIGDVEIDGVKKFLMFLMDTNTELGAKYSIDAGRKKLGEMDQKELSELMDKALDDKDFKRAKEIGKFIK